MGNVGSGKGGNVGRGNGRTRDRYEEGKVGRGKSRK